MTSNTQKAKSKIEQLEGLIARIRRQSGLGTEAAPASPPPTANASPPPTATPAPDSTGMSPPATPAPSMTAQPAPQPPAPQPPVAAQPSPTASRTPPPVTDPEAATPPPPPPAQTQVAAPPAPARQNAVSATAGPIKIAASISGIRQTPTAAAAPKPAAQPAGPPDAPQTSIFAPKKFPKMQPVAGVRLATGAAGVKYTGRDDVMLVEIAVGSSIAGVFTKSGTRAAPVLWCEQQLAARAAGAKLPGPTGIVVNSGNANAFTGADGRQSVTKTVNAAGDVLGASPGNIFVASTGVIGEPLPVDRITSVLADTAARLSPDNWEKAAHAIMTTDAYPKAARAAVKIGDTDVNICGIAKGAGMIAPDMATMLVFLFTDAAIAQPALQKMLTRITATTFNAITVDGDTSTSDTLLLAATGQAGNELVEDMEDPVLQGFRKALRRVMLKLAHLVVQDGEGATKFAEINVTGGKTRKAAEIVARSIANSPLVKTALAGSDPNWGRIIMAVGKSGVEVDRDKLSISFGDIRVAENGWLAPGYSEEQGAAYFRQSELVITVDLGGGDKSAKIWTCDIGHPYVTCNADYRS